MQDRDDPSRINPSNEVLQLSTSRCGTWDGHLHCLTECLRCQLLIKARNNKTNTEHKLASDGKMGRSIDAVSRLLKDKEKR